MTDEEAKREMAPQKPVGLTREQDDMWRFLCTMAVAVITNKAQPAPFIDSGNGPERYVMPPIKLRDDQEMALVYDLWPHLSWSFQFALTEGWDRAQVSKLLPCRPRPAYCASDHHHENPQELKRQMPAFVFERQHEIELEGFTLAGLLIVDLPQEPTEDEWRLIPLILEKLVDAAESGRMPDNAMVYGWHGDDRPPDAVDTNNDEVMAAWAKDRLKICVRLDSHSPDGTLRIRPKDFL